MGRPPIGKRAMTATERQRRWRLKSRANKPAPKPAASVKTVARLQARVRQLEADHAALCAAMGKLLHVMAQRLADRSKRARLVFEAGFREFQAELGRLRSVRDLASRPKTRLDKVFDGRRLHSHSNWISQAYALVVGPGLERGRRAAGVGTHTRAGQILDREPRQGPSRERFQGWCALASPKRRRAWTTEIHDIVPSSRLATHARSCHHH